MNRFINSLEFNNHSYYYCDLQKLYDSYPKLRKLPICLKILLESNIRNSSSEIELNEIIKVFLEQNSFKYIKYFPNRVVLNDSTCTPLIIDLSSMRDIVKEQGYNPNIINPKVMVDFIVEDSEKLDSVNILSIDKQQLRDKEKHEFIKWAGKSFDNFSVIPPNKDHWKQVNLEYLSTMICLKNEEKVYLYPEIIYTNNNNTSSVNSLGVLELNSKSFDIESILLSGSNLVKLPNILGIEIKGAFVQGVSIRDVALFLEDILKDNDIEGKFVEFYGDAVKNISINDRTQLSKIVTQNKAICGYFPMDENAISFVEQTRGVDASFIQDYYLKQGLFSNIEKSDYINSIVLDLSLIKPVVLGPRKDENKICVKDIPGLLKSFKNGNFVSDNDIVHAKIFISNCSSSLMLLIQTGLLAKKAIELGIFVNDNIKKELYIESDSFKMYLQKLGLLDYIYKLGFCFISDNKNLVQRVEIDIERFNLDVSLLTSEDVILEDRYSSLIKSKWQLSPALILAYCFKGNMNFDITTESIMADIYLSDIWPSTVEVNEYFEKLESDIFTRTYKNIYSGSEYWKLLDSNSKDTYSWNVDSTYIKPSNFFDELDLDKINIDSARILALFDYKVSSNELLVQGQIPPYSSTSLYLQEHGLRIDEFDSFENRTTNVEVITRATLSSIELKNKIVSPKEGGYTKDFDTNEILSIYDFSIKMKELDKPLVIFASDEFASGKYFDFLAKGIKLLGVSAIIANSFDSSHKSDLVKVGILPLEFIDDDIESLYLKGDEIISIESSLIKVNDKVQVQIRRYNESRTIEVKSRLDTQEELLYYKNGGVLSYLFKSIKTK